MFCQVGMLKMRVVCYPVCAACDAEESSGDRWYEREDGALVCSNCARPGMDRCDTPEGYCERRVGDLPAAIEAYAAEYERRLTSGVMSARYSDVTRARLSGIRDAVKIARGEEVRFPDAGD
jgi:hypothetical protein